MYWLITLASPREVLASGPLAPSVSHLCFSLCSLSHGQKRQAFARRQEKQQFSIYSVFQQHNHKSKAPFSRCLSLSLSVSLGEGFSCPRSAFTLYFQIHHQDQGPGAHQPLVLSSSQGPQEPQGHPGGGTQLTTSLFSHHTGSDEISKQATKRLHKVSEYNFQGSPFKILFVLFFVSSSKCGPLTDIILYFFFSYTFFFSFLCPYIHLSSEEKVNTTAFKRKKYKLQY